MNSHNHVHSHPHAHDHSHHASYQKLLIGFWVILGFMVVEIFSGWFFHSLALMSDGFHMLTDAIALGLATFAVALNKRKATEEKSFGFKRFEVLVAFGNGIAILLLSIFISFQSIDRLNHPLPVAAKPMLFVASLGMIVNVFVAWWLHSGGEEKSLNEQSAFLHILGDLGASLAAIIAGILILTKSWLWADPVLSLVIAVVLVLPAVKLIRQSAHILVEGTPEGIQLETVRKTMLAVPQVKNVHDLHLWTLNGRDLYLSAHVETLPGNASEMSITQELTNKLNCDFHVNHITLQVGHCLAADCETKC